MMYLYQSVICQRDTRWKRTFELISVYLRFVRNVEEIILFKNKEIERGNRHLTSSMNLKYNFITNERINNRIASERHFTLPQSSWHCDDVPSLRLTLSLRRPSLTIATTFGLIIVSTFWQGATCWSRHTVVRSPPIGRARVLDLYDAASLPVQVNHNVALLHAVLPSCPILQIHILAFSEACNPLLHHSVSC